MEYDDNDVCWQLVTMFAFCLNGIFCATTYQTGYLEAPRKLWKISGVVHVCYIRWHSWHHCS